MHRLVPDFIIQQYAAGKFQGHFRGSVLFVDISGFSVSTDRLMQHGQHGAEVLAGVMRAVFDPLVHAVYAYGGFIATFAGDAFTAIFYESGDIQQILPALAAGRLIQETARENAKQETVYGVFSFSAKVGLATGIVEWGILQDRQEQRAYYFFKGQAVDNSAAAEHYAQKGDFILDSATHEVVAAQVVTEKLDDFYRVQAIAGALTPANPVHLAPVNLDLMSRFFQQDLIIQRLTGEFRPVFYLFTGLQGTPSLEELREFMQHVFRLQENYGGFLNNLDFGDKGCYLYFFWGAPTRKENDINRILNFALDLQAQADRPLRMGITYRIAHAGFIGSSLREEYTCYGRGVNLAARFMTSAGWGEIWIDEDVNTRAGQFKTDFVGELPFKGFAEPQKVYSLLGRAEQTRSPFYSGRFVGREYEWEQLNNWFRPLSERRFAGAITLVGEAGIGKSRLVYEYLDTAEILDFCRLFICQTDEIFRQSMNPFRYWLREYFNQSPHQSDEVNKEQFTTILNSLISESISNTLVNSLERGRSFLGVLVDLYWPDSLYAALEPQFRFENTLVVLKTLIIAESQRRPVLIVIEDIQWLDEDSRHFLLRLTRNVDRFPFALIMTSREEPGPGFLESKVPQTSILLNPLAETAVTNMATATLGWNPSPALQKFLWQRTDGNPFFVEQILLFMQENKWLQEDMNMATLEAAAHHIPTDVQALLVARLDRLPAQVKDVAQSAAVLGREFERPILNHMRAPDIPDLAERFLEAERETIWHPLDERRYLFQHALMREAAYNMQVQTRLLNLHRQAAEAYETVYQSDLPANYGQIAYHYDQAKVVVKALSYYERAGDQARENFQNEAALAHYGRALALADEKVLETRYRLYNGREAVLGWLGRREAQQTDLEQLQSLAGRLSDDSKLAEIALRKTALALATGEFDQAIVAARQSVVFAQASQDPLAEARAMHRLSRAHWQKGQHEQARPYLEQAIFLAQENQGFTEEALCFYDLSVLDYYQQRYEQAGSNLDRALFIYRRLNNKRGEIECLSLTGILQNARGDYLAAQAAYEQALSLTRSVGYLYGESRVLGLLGNAYFNRGDYQSSVLHHKQGLEILRELNDREGEAISLDTLGLTYFYLQDYAIAQEYLRRAVTQSQEIQAKNSAGYALTHLGFTLAQLGDYNQASFVLNEALTIRRELGLSAVAIDTLGGLAEVKRKTGRLAEALIIVDEILDWLESNGPSGIELPIQVYLNCYRVLQEASKNDPSLQKRSQDVLAAGKTLLGKYAAQIQDETLRRQFLQNVPYNRSLNAAG